MSQKRTFQIYRYDPDKDAKPYMQTIEIELDGNERMLLDALVKLKKVDPTISFRRSCREGVCGSDAMNINGKNGLACLTNMMHAARARSCSSPLPGLPVIRDLIRGHDAVLQAVRLDQALPDQRHAAARQGAPAVARRARRARTACTSASCAPAARPAAQLLVEPRQVRGPRRSAAGLPLHRGQPRSGHARLAWTTWKTRTVCSVATPS